MNILAIITQNIVPFFLILTILVFVHEFGHYFSARRHGVKVDVFSIGFGPEIFGWTDRSKTRWKFSLIPLGGYVKMFGDEESSQTNNEKIFNLTKEEKKHSFFFKSVWQRIEISAAGPLANYIFAIFIFAFIFGAIGQPKWVEESFVGAVLSDSVADKAGLRGGDQIVSINGNKIKKFEEISLIIQKNINSDTLNLSIKRSGKLLPEIISISPNSKEGKFSLGVIRAQEFVRCSPLISIWESIKYSISLSSTMLNGVWRMVSCQESPKGLAGPIGIAQMSGEISQRDWASILSFIALLSVNLGLINLFPIPMLDGGHLIFYFIEAIRGKALNSKIQEFSFRIGFLLVMALFIYVTFNDVIRLFGN